MFHAELLSCIAPSESRTTRIAPHLMSNASSTWVHLELKKSHKQEAEKKVQGPTFQQLVGAYLAWGETKQPKPMKPRTVQDYRNKLVNQMMPELGGDTPVKQLAWDATGKDGRTGREVVLAAKQKITLRGKGSQSDKCLAVLKSCFDYAVSIGRMERNQNPAVLIGQLALHLPPRPILFWSGTSCQVL